MFINFILNFYNFLFIHFIVNYRVLPLQKYFHSCGDKIATCSSSFEFIARTVKTVMSCEPNRASPYSVDLTGGAWCSKMTTLRHVEITSMYGNTSTQCCKDSIKPVMNT